MLNIVLVTHEGIGTSLLKVAETITGAPQKNVACFEVAMDTDPATIEQAALDNIRSTRLDTLLLTDLVGSTPYNIAARLAEKTAAGMVSGLNLPMLLRVLNYRACRLREVVEKAIEGGRVAIQGN